MRETFMTHILAADRKFYEGPLESLIVPTNEGQYGILAKHRNVITATVPGVLKYKLPNQEFKTAAVSSGLVLRRLTLIVLKRQKRKLRKNFFKRRVFKSIKMLSCI